MKEKGDDDITDSDIQAYGYQMRQARNRQACGGICVIFLFIVAINMIFFQFSQ